MTVFISYRHTDFSIAKAINKKLNEAGIKTYLDKLDLESQTTEDITSVITNKISQSSHLIAIVSERTALSWWVPFEIGEATITGRRIASYQADNSKLPEYLDKWPKMKTENHLNSFIQEYKDELSFLFENEYLGGEDFMKSFSGNVKNANDFHQKLKNKIESNY
ncbi:toll/interleukin-1 receptor domain-containing protein [Pectobacterium brasiliense]|uniref:toll/interleukin-1 receptor domain-containing protein n=1 Tax=Pectobacterium brasiliense TaxID=180957 RepID=UPI00227B8B29|nr:toll/interleukin-1 receptor domain-containing protein [Pectobacterium brasiliense]WGL26774.1 toll/interleukin-1 receptor domain-containing protein [Pectobacterium brasiliense]